MKTKTFENGDVKIATCHRSQSKSEHLSKMVRSQAPAFSSFLHVLVWIHVGENDMRMLVWMKIFCFGYKETTNKTVLFHGFDKEIQQSGFNVQEFCL